MSIELKIKSKHLSEEAKIIRFEERKLLASAASQRRNMYAEQADNTYWQYYSINKHRRVDVRNENRATYLARAYLANKTYASVECAGRTIDKEYIFKTVVLKRTLEMINKYRLPNSIVVTKERLEAWAN